MKENHISEFLTDYADGLLGEDLKEEVERHLKECESCREELNEINTLFQSFEDEAKTIIPSDQLRGRFLKDLETEKSLENKPLTLKTKAAGGTSQWANNLLKVAASVLLLMGALALGKQLQNQPNHVEYADLVRENSAYKQTALISLMGNKSASKRIQGVNFVSEYSEPDQAIVKALTERMINDENTNVRRTAVEVLSEFTSTELVKNSFIEALRIEKDPGIQIAIIQILGDIQEKKAAKLMQELLIQEDIQPYVKDELEAVLQNII